jgi:short subunit dehydrogenase-like uncharacterized protein
VTADPLLVYGVTGYTGRLVVDALLGLGVRPIVAGRDAARVAAFAVSHRLEGRAASLVDASQLCEILRGVRVVLHTAGPFAQTAAPMVDACLRAGAHYLDITGETSVFEALARLDGAARGRGVMLMPGVGYDVVPTDCLAAYMNRRLPGACRLAIGIAGLRFMTPASAKTFVGHAGSGVWIRRDGVLQQIGPGSNPRVFEFDGEMRWAVGVSLPDVVTAYHSTGIPDISGYYAATPAMRGVVTAWRHAGSLIALPPVQAMMGAWADMLWRGPSEEERHAAPTTIVAEVEDRSGRRLSALLYTPEPYSLTAATSAAIAARVLSGDFEPGFETPARVFGADYILSFPGVRREDSPADATFPRQSGSARPGARTAR